HLLLFGVPRLQCLDLVLDRLVVRCSLGRTALRVSSPTRSSWIIFPRRRTTVSRADSAGASRAPSSQRMGKRTWPTGATYPPARTRHERWRCVLRDQAATRSTPRRATVLRSAARQEARCDRRWTGTAARLSTCCRYATVWAGKMFQPL